MIGGDAGSEPSYGVGEALTKLRRALAKGTYAAAAWVLLCVAVPALAEERLPFALQAVLLKKVVSFDPAFASSPPKILIVKPKSGSEAGELAASLRQVGFEAQVVTAAELPGALEGVTLLYALPGAYTPALGDLCSSRGILTVTYERNLVAQGLASLGMTRGPTGKPEILVHLKRLKSEGHYLPSGLLTLAVVF